MCKGPWQNVTANTLLCGLVEPETAVNWCGPSVCVLWFSSTPRYGGAPRNILAYLRQRLIVPQKMVAMALSVEPIGFIKTFRQFSYETKIPLFCFICFAGCGLSVQH